MTRRGLLVVVSLLALCLVAGCTERTVQGSQAIYRFAWWVGPALIVASVLAAIGGWLLRKRTEKWSLIAMCMGPFVLVFVVPMIYFDRVLIDDDHFEARYGSKRTEFNIRFDDLREIRHIPVEGSRGSKDAKLQCVTKSGETIEMAAGGDLVKFTIHEILERAKARGVTVVNEVD